MFSAALCVRGETPRRADAKDRLQWRNGACQSRRCHWLLDIDHSGVSLTQLTKDDLAELGVMSIGHRLAILRARAACQQDSHAAAGSEAEARVAPALRPFASA